jgi:hypothetical protein
MVGSCRKDVGRQGHQKLYMSNPEGRRGVGRPKCDGFGGGRLGEDTNGNMS